MSNSAENTAGKQRGKPFKKGASGNPAGKPKGAKHKATLAAEILLDGEAETLTRKAIDLAKAGDMAALRLCLDRIIPPRRSRPVYFNMPPLKKADDSIKAMSAITAAVAEGDLTPADAAELGKLVECYVKALEIIEFEKRIRVLEEIRR